LCHRHLDLGLYQQGSNEIYIFENFIECNAPQDHNAFYGASVTSGFGTFSIVGDLSFILDVSFMFTAPLTTSYHSDIIFLLIFFVCHIISGFMTRFRYEACVLFVLILFSVVLFVLTRSTLRVKASEKYIEVEKIQKDGPGFPRANVSNLLHPKESN